MLALTLALATTAVEAQPSARAVLVLFSDEGRLPATNTLYTGIEHGLGEIPGVTVLSQYLDVTNFGSEAHDGAMAAFLKSRYAGRQVDVVISIGPPAAAFAHRHGDDIWPGMRHVAAAYPGDDAGGTALAGADARAPISLEYLATAEAAVTLLPDTREIVLVAGSGATDRRYLERTKAMLEPLAARLRITELTNLSLTATQDRLAALADDAIVLVTMYFQDADGRRFQPLEAVQALAARSRRPVFGVFGTWLGTGVIGGYTVDYESVGRQAAASAAALLKGHTHQGSAAASRWLFDARALDRFGIDESRLPAGSLVLFRDPGLWARYRWWVVGATAALTLQAAIIGALLIERRARRRGAVALQDAVEARQRTEAQMQLQLHELAHLNVLAAIGQNAASMAHELNQPLTSVLSNAQALQLMLQRQGAPNRQALEILDDIISEDKRASDIIQRMRRMMKKETFDWAPVDVNAIVEDVTHLLSPEAAHSGVRVTTELSKSLPAARGDRVQLQQVMLNLVQNAVHAAAGRTAPGNRVRVATSHAGAQVNVVVADSGTGLDQQTLPRLFEPFYTTKANGLGLGLSISRTIVEQHGGAIAARNAPGGGAEFSIRLPTLESSP